MTGRKVILKSAPEGTLRYAHPWIYRNQISSVEGSPGPGEMVDVFSHRGRFQGKGSYNDRSEISVRIFTRDDSPIDEDFFFNKIAQALEFRLRRNCESNAFRLISSEADGLPGLVVDVYGEVLVVQFLTAGTEMLRGPILDALRRAVPNRGIYERSDTNSRKLEGLPEKAGWIEKNCGEEVWIVERDVRYRVEFGEGHKTGCYLDQSENRLILRDWGFRGSALDAFCYQGAFGLHLAKTGMQVTGIEILEDNIRRAIAHRDANGIGAERLDFRLGNAFDLLRESRKAGERYDLVILDPPSFVKRKTALEGALAGFKEILLMAMQILNNRGTVAVFSCSYHVDELLLLRAAMSAAIDSRKGIRILKFLKQAGDHPICPFVPETYYLKGFLLEISDL